MHELLTDWRAPLTVYTDLSNGWRLDCLRSGEFNLVAWLNFLWGGYLPSLNINYVSTSRDMGKMLPQLNENFSRSGLYYNQSHHCNVMTPLRIFYLSLCFSSPVSGAFLRNCLREYVPAIIASIMAKFKQILWERLEIFWDKVLRFIKTAK